MSDIDARSSRSKRKLENSMNDNASYNKDDHIIDLKFPPELEKDLAVAIFELGLRQSSPKILLGLMPQCTGLNTEHIKSHLQKYRIHHERSKEGKEVFGVIHVKEI